MNKQASTIEGQFLIAMPRMGDQRFESAVILVCAHSEEGAMGFIVNQPTKTPAPEEFWKKLGIIPANDLVKMPDEVASKPLHTGGPVEPGRGFVLHSPDYESETTIRVNESVSLTATLEILKDMALGKGPSSFLVALGYSGWSAGQLEEEIAANGWLVCAPNPEVIFDDKDETKYMRVMNSLGIDPALISADSGHA